jgi:hypothetical protein
MLAVSPLGARPALSICLIAYIDVLQALSWSLQMRNFRVAVRLLRLFIAIARLIIELARLIA